MSDGYRIISRWFFDVCVFEALESFRNGDYAFFANITKHIESLVVLPMDGRGDTVLKLRFMQFLTRINNGDKLDLTFEEPKTPLESALAVLESLCREMDVPQREQQRVHNAIAEMLVIVCIKSGEFEKAEEILHTHFSAAADSAGKKKLLMNLIRKRRSSHSVLQLSSYRDFKQDMLEFIERLYRVPEPFLTQMLKRSGRLEPTALSRDKEKEDSPQVQLSLQSLQKAYGELSEEYGVSVPFSQLVEEVEMEAQQQSRETDGDELHLALSETPMEPAAERVANGEPHESRYAGMTISRLVTEEDSQPSGDETQITGGPSDQPSPQRVVIGSDPESDDPEVQTVRPASTHKQRHSSFIIRSDPESDDPEVQTVRPASTDKQRHSRVIIRSDPESDDPEVQTVRPASTDKQRHNSFIIGSDPESDDPEVQTIRPVSTHKQRHSSGGELRLTPARRRIPPAAKHKDKKAHSNRRAVVSSDEEFDDPPSHRHTPGQKEHDDSEPECVLEVRSTPHSSTPETEVHSTRPHLRCHSSPADSRSSAGGKRARWQDASGTHEDWSDEESLFNAAAGPSRKKKYARKLWTVQESDWLKDGVRRFGVGRWEQIRNAFPFTGRSACNLKDRWRTMIKLKMV
ncbi:telomeric repeat binding factor a isoform X2 [Pseudorasbora parva]|uniref:telomeric repeat binding factor a isoform X2 n=1 Tax=Pseudorasbora parva TaxID=51549 RepID=UPI00351DBE03